jgi:sugar phosphate isomerase/epimerase
MPHRPALPRRRFLQNVVLGSTALVAASRFPAAALGAVTKPEHAAFAGLKVGIASYSLRKFSLDQAITMTQQAGVKYLTLKDMHLPLTSTADECQAARQKIEAAGLVLLGGGVIYLNDKPDEVRRAFDYARQAGMPTIVACPDPAALDTVEKLAKEYDIRVAIHNHGPGDKRYPSPLDVLRLVKDRDAHLGVCIDVGHTVRLGEDPVAVIEACASRLYDFHIKDVTQATAKGGPADCGSGVIDLVAVLKTLLALKFPYHVALEYEAHGEAPLPGMIASFAYLRGVLDALAV